MRMLVVVVTTVSGQITVQPGQEECFYQSVKQDNTLAVEYQVIDAGSYQLAELDINFSLVDPRGSPVILELRRPAGSHHITAEVGPLIDIHLHSFVSRAGVW